METESNAAELDREARTSSTLLWAVRTGLVAYGLVHLLIAWVAVRLVFPGGSGTASGSGALAQLAGDTLGNVSLMALAACFAALVVWQLIAAAVGYRNLDGWARHIQRLGAVSRVVVYGYFGFNSAQFAVQGRSGSGGNGSDSITARLMAAPGGQLIIALVGLTIAGIGIGLAIFGLQKGFMDQLDEQARTQSRRTAIVVIGQIGYVVKGAAFVIVGALFGWAALSQDPQNSGGLDQSLTTMLGHGLGGAAVVVAGAGIGCFGLYCFARSRHIDKDSLTS
jgi:hypothetical protein